jgi:hypothetical protein
LNLAGQCFGSMTDSLATADVASLINAKKALDAAHDATNILE